MKLRHADLARTLARSAKRQHARSFEAVSTREGYDRWADSYDEGDNPLIALEERELPGLIGDLAGLRVIDIGCGTGRWTERLVNAGAKVTGVDFSPAMLEKARARLGTSVELIEHDLAEPLPFADGSFDVALSALVLEHIVNLPLYFGELARICSPGGRIILSAMHPALMLLGVQAEFTEAQSGRDVRPQSHAHQVSDFVMAAVEAGLKLEYLSEHEVDEDLQQRSAKSSKWAGWPFLVVLILRRAS